MNPRVIVAGKWIPVRNISSLGPNGTNGGSTKGSVVAVVENFLVSNKRQTPVRLTFAKNKLR